MIELLTGVPGSGKTYFAVERLHKEYQKRTRPIFTNINLVIPFDDILQPLDIKDFHEFCKSELSYYEEYRQNNPDGGNYDQALKDSGLLEKYGNALLLWDECHNDLDINDPAYVRWMSYHRHFEGMDVLLITQNISLIHRKYKGFIDKFYFGVNASKRIFSSTFKYKVYTDHKQYEKFLIETISLASKKEIFALYDSGHYKTNKSAMFKKLIPIVLITIFTALFFKYIVIGYIFGRHIDQNATDGVPMSNDPTMTQMTPEQIQAQNDLKALNEEQRLQNEAYLKEQNNPALLPPPPMTQNTSGSSNSAPGTQATLSRYLVRFQCTQTYCYFPSNRFTISLSTMQRFFTEFGGKILTAEPLTNDISIISAVVPSELYFMIESHNIESRSDNYGPQSQNNNYSSSSPVEPKFAPSPGV